MRCRLLIRPGQPIVRDMTLRRFVHASCAKVQQPTVQRAEQAQSGEPPAESQSNGPHGLAARSLESYQVEWDRYVAFAGVRRQQIPGATVPWDMQLLWEYLQARSETCKPATIKQILTKLSHFGAMNNFILANSKFDGAPAAHKAIHRMLQQLKLDARANAAATGVQYAPVDRCTPIGVRGVSMLLSSFQVIDREHFLRLSRVDRHNVANAVMQHTGAMRFGQFADRDYPVSAFIVDGADASLRLVTDWSRYAGRRQFAIEFASSPQFASMWYKIRAPNGDLITSYPAATLLRWHFEQIQQAGETRVFAPVLGATISREARQQWLRTALLDALPLAETEARALIDQVTPHSFRSGLSGDLFREGVALQRVGSICRWNSQRVVRLYAERPCMSMARLTIGFRLINRV